MESNPRPSSSTCLGTLVGWRVVKSRQNRCRKFYCLWMGLCPSLSSCVTSSSGTGGAGISSDDSNS